jgi:hypothetical protein
MHSKSAFRRSGIRFAARMRDNWRISAFRFAARMRDSGGIYSQCRFDRTAIGWSARGCLSFAAARAEGAGTVRSTTVLGIAIAALFAAGVLAVTLFGRHDDWFLRAAQDNAVRCLARSPCPRLAGGGSVTFAAPPPLTAASSCANPRAWQAVEGASGARIVVRCRDGVTYLYHMGRLAGRQAGAEQWVVCADPQCRRESALFDRL